MVGYKFHTMFAIKMLSLHDSILLYTPSGIYIYRHTKKKNEQSLQLSAWHLSIHILEVWTILLLIKSFHITGSEIINVILVICKTMSEVIVLDTVAPHFQNINHSINSPNTGANSNTLSHASLASKITGGLVKITMGLVPYFPFMRHDLDFVMWD